MSNNIHVSVIIPAYNAEKYIDKCITSLISQSIFENLEIIVINDGSIDATAQIVNEYSKNYKNIKVFHTKNQGVSSARNLGIKQALGEYITFVDADDWLEMSCYEKMYANAKLYSADIVAAGLYIDINDKKVIDRKVVLQNTVADGKKAVREYLYGNLDVHIVNKIFRRDIVKKHAFDITLKIAEDRLFLLECLLDAKKVIFIQESFYHYYQNENSAMNQKFSKNNLDNIFVGKSIINKVKEKYPELLPYAQAMYVNMECRLYGELFKARLIQKYPGEYTILKQDIKSFKIFKNLKYITKKHMCALILAKISPSLYNFMRSDPVLKFKR